MIDGQATPDPDPAAVALTRSVGRIRLRHLQCFLAVADAGQLGRAALQLSITQPAVSKTLKELEDLLGCALFVRGRAGVTMTPAAAAFYRHASSSVQSLSAAVHSVVGRPDAAALRLGVLPTIAPVLLPPLWSRSGAALPGATVQVRTGRNAALLAQLRSRELDAVIARLSDPEAMAGLSFEPLYTEPLGLIARRDHPLSAAARASGDRPSPALLHGLSGVPWVLPLPGTLLRQVADAFLAGHRLQPRHGVVETLDTALAAALVQGGDAVWIAPRGIAAVAAGLCAWPLALSPHEQVGLILRSDTPPSPALATLLDALRRLARSRSRAG